MLRMLVPHGPLVDGRIEWALRRHYALLKPLENIEVRR